MKKGIYLLLIIFTYISALAQDTYEKNNTDSTFVLSNFKSFAPDFIDEKYSIASEFSYVGLRIGVSNGFSAQPKFNANKYLITPVGEMQAQPAEKYLGYVPGFVADIYYHADFSENIGIFIGLEYNHYGMSSKYETKYGEYSAIEKNMVNAIGVPLAFKYGPKKIFYDEQAYIYAGLKYSFTLNMVSVQKANWLDATAKAKVPSVEIERTNLGLFFGINYKIFNLQLDYLPNNFLNIDNLSSSGYQTALGQPDKLFFVSAAISTPMNGWLGTKNRKVKMFFRKVRKMFGL